MAHKQELNDDSQIVFVLRLRMFEPFISLGLQEIIKKLPVEFISHNCFERVIVVLFSKEKLLEFSVEPFEIFLRRIFNAEKGHIMADFVVVLILIDIVVVDVLLFSKRESLVSLQECLSRVLLANLLDLEK